MNKQYRIESYKQRASQVKANLELLEHLLDKPYCRTHSQDVILKKQSLEQELNKLNDEWIIV